MRALGFEYKKPEILKLLKDHDKNGSGRIDFNDFNKLSTGRVGDFISDRAHAFSGSLGGNQKGL